MEVHNDEVQYWVYHPLFSYDQVNEGEFHLTLNLAPLKPPTDIHVKPSDALIHFKVFACNIDQEPTQK